MTEPNQYNPFYICSIDNPFKWLVTQPTTWGQSASIFEGNYTNSCYGGSQGCSYKTYLIYLKLSLAIHQTTFTVRNFNSLGTIIKKMIVASQVYPFVDRLYLVLKTRLLPLMVTGLLGLASGHLLKVTSFCVKTQNNWGTFTWICLWLN